MHQLQILMSLTACLHGSKHCLTKSLRHLRLTHTAAETTLPTQMEGSDWLSSKYHHQSGQGLTLEIWRCIPYMGSKIEASDKGFSIIVHVLGL